MMSVKTYSALIGLLMIHACWAFPNGGPIDACVKAKPNQPNHSGTLSQPERSNPYTVEASSDYYRPGEEITGELTTIILQFINFKIMKKAPINQLTFILIITGNSSNTVQKGEAEEIIYFSSGLLDRLVN